MRKPIADLNGREFDVLIIGGGINGAAAAQKVAAEGYDVLLVEKGDYGSGSSSRSSRLLHCGLRYLAPGRSMWDFVRHPSRLVTALVMARSCMEARTEFTRDTAVRSRLMKFSFPIYKNGPYRGWQIDIAFFILRLLWRQGPPLNYRRISGAEAAQAPLTRELRDLDKLQSVATYDEYEFDWPERICMDAILDAQRLGAQARNYTTARLQDRGPDGLWRAALADQLGGGSAEVRAKIVLNTAGIWADQVNHQAAPDAGRRVLGTKGCHIVVQLPSGYSGHGVATLNSKSEPFYCIPWHGLHFFGPTETVYDGDKDDIHVTEAEQAWLLSEANRLMPGANLSSRDIRLTWAGVRPLTYDPALPLGKRSREIHDLAKDGLPNVLVMTAGPITSYRSAGELLAAEVAKRIPARRAVQRPDYGPKLAPENDNSPFLIEGDRSVRLSDLQHAITEEHAVTLTDLLFRRTGLCWRHKPSQDEVERAASVLALELGLSPQARADAVAEFWAEHQRLLGVRAAV